MREAQVQTELNSTFVTRALGAGLDSASRALREAGCPYDVVEAARSRRIAAVGDVLHAASDPTVQDDLRRSLAGAGGRRTP